MSQTANPVYSLIVRREIRSSMTSRARRSASPRRRHDHAVDRAALDRQWTENHRLHRQTVVGTPARSIVSSPEECAAVPMGQPEDLGAIAQGFPRLAFTNEAVADLIFNVDMARRAWARRTKTQW